MNIAYTGSIDQETVINFITETLNPISLDTKINFYLNTEGGDVSSMYALVNALNEYESVKIYPWRNCSSSGFLFTILSKHSSYIIDECLSACIHYPYVFANISTNKKYCKHDEDYEKKQRKLSQDIMDKLFKTYLTEVEYKKVQNEDVTLYPNRLREIYEIKNRKEGTI
jgi:ATP-dependent protease ClpP protease subunit